jgi:hypothetical protein
VKIRGHSDSVERRKTSTAKFPLESGIHWDRNREAVIRREEPAGLHE